MQALLYFIVTLVILIVVHEFGHFWVARRCGVEVLKFSIGFGRPLWKKTDKYGTEYIMAVIPLGGYVKMLDERESDVADEDLDKTFNRQPLRSRIAILAAGPLANLLFAVLIYWVIFVTGIPGIRPIIGDIEPNSAADIAQFVVGSEIKAVNGVETPTWSSVHQSLLQFYQAGDALDFSIAMDGAYMQRQLKMPTQNQASSTLLMLKSLGISPVYVELVPVIHSVIKGGAADQAGLRQGDLVLSVDGGAIASWSALVELVQASPDKALQVVIERAGQSLNVVLVPDKTVDNLGQIGAQVDSLKTDIPDELQAELRYGLFTAASQSIRKTWILSLLTIKNLFGVATGAVSSKNIGGPISIAQTALASADIGIFTFMHFLAMISISLAMLNFLPIPILDGGNLFLCFIEWVRGKPFSECAQIKAQKVGVVVLLLMISLAFFNDFSRLFG